MATIFVTPTRRPDREHRFFLWSAVIMAVLVASGFGLQLAMGRSSFAVPIYLHVHAFFFFGWTVLYLVQNALVYIGSVALHRRLGWVALGWIPAMVIMGTFVTVAAARTLHVPFFFQPAYFLVMNPLSLYVFAGLAGVAIAMRKRTLWHRRLMFCAMSILLGPAIGRIIPAPMLIPFAGEAVFAVVILFPIAGIIRDLRADGRVHPAWLWGLGSIIAMQVMINVIAFSPLGPAIYRFATAGSAGATVSPLAFPSPPWARAKTARAAS